MSRKVWVLTSEIDECNQKGEYFEAVFAEKPSILTLVGYFAAIELPMSYIQKDYLLDLARHIRDGGGPQGSTECSTEYKWYWLREVECY